MKYIGSDYIPKNNLKGFPLEIIDKMIEEQVEQGNPENVRIFEYMTDSNKTGKGFTWGSTEEGDYFWKKVITFEKFDVFFERYPKGFYKGDYVVLVAKGSVGDIPENYVYKLSKDVKNNFDVELDLQGSTKNGFSCKKELRHATTEEIKNYKKENKPVKVTMEKKIIGYKAPYDLFEGAVKKDSVYITSFAKRYTHYYHESMHGLPKEIVETWEPVYEEIEKTFKLDCIGGTFELTVSKKGLYYAPDDKYLSPFRIQALIDHVPTMIDCGYTFKTNITSIDMGCKKEVPVEDIRKCLAYYFSL